MNNEILTQRQVEILTKIGNEDYFGQNFYLTGGTALAAFYLRHRYSEDLDFFSEREVDPAIIDVFFKKIKTELEISSIDFQQSYNRNLFFLHFTDGEVLKTEFTYFPFPRIDATRIEVGVSVDSVLDIAVNKLFTIYQRTQARDYIDLFFICKEFKFDIDGLKQKARIKFDFNIDPLQLGSQFIRVKEAKGYPRMIVDIVDTEWQDFFMDQAKKLKPSILF